jgi:hypothetical protein
LGVIFLLLVDFAEDGYMVFLRLVLPIYLY